MLKYWPIAVIALITALVLCGYIRGLQRALQDAEERIMRVGRLAKQKPR